MGLLLKYIPCFDKLLCKKSKSFNTRPFVLSPAFRGIEGQTGI